MSGRWGGERAGYRLKLALTASFSNNPYEAVGESRSTWSRSTCAVAAKTRSAAARILSSPNPDRDHPGALIAATPAAHPRTPRNRPARRPAHRRRPGRSPGAGFDRPTFAASATNRRHRTGRRDPAPSSVPAGDATPSNRPAARARASNAVARAICRHRSSSPRLEKITVLARGEHLPRRQVERTPPSARICERAHRPTPSTLIVMLVERDIHFVGDASQATKCSRRCPPAPPSRSKIAARNVISQRLQRALSPHAASPRRRPEYRSCLRRESTHARPAGHRDIDRRAAEGDGKP